MIRALIFDFDGLVLETEGPVFQSWQELYRSYGCYLSFAKWATIIGTTDGEFDPWDDLEKQVGRFLDRSTVDQQRLQRELDLIAARPIMPGVQEYLEDARRLGLKLGMASSSSSEWVTGHLIRLGLINYFDCIKTRDDVRQTKPDPELFLAVLAELDIRPDQAIVFEDSPNGILAANRAGIYCVVVPNELTRTLPIDQAHKRLDSLADLPLENLLQEIEVSQG